MYFHDLVTDSPETWHILKNADIIKDMYNLCMYVHLSISNVQHQYVISSLMGVL